MFIDDDEPDPDDLRRFTANLQRVAREMAESGKKAQENADRWAKYRNDPIGFFREVLGIEPWESDVPGTHGQADVIRSIVTHDQIAVKSGQKTGKSCLAVGLALWWVCTGHGRRAFMTAPSFPQVKDILWKEMARIFAPRIKGAIDATGKPLPPPYRDSLEVVFDVLLPLDPATGIKWKNGNDVVGKSTDKPERMAGISSPGGTLFIIDESSGFADGLYEAVAGNLTGGGKLLAITNPTRTSGWFFSLFIDRPVDWLLFTLNSENTPNARSGLALVPGLATKSRIESMRKNAGEDYQNNPFYMVRVLGEFPPQGTNSVISMTLLERATNAWKMDAPAEPASLVIGVDVAREGDDTSVIQAVRGFFAYPPLPVPASLSADGANLAGEVVRYARSLRFPGEEVRINIDGIGVGASPLDWLRRHPACVDEGWMHPQSLIVGESADSDNYTNLRSQLWFGCAEWLKEGGKLQKSERVIKELLAATYSFDNRGRIQVEPKKIMKISLGGKSPDYADALCMATYRGNRGGHYQVSYDAAPDLRHTSLKSDAWTDVEDSGERGEWG